MIWQVPGPEYAGSMLQLRLPLSPAGSGSSSVALSADPGPMFQTTIVELKEGRFRYWFRSDVKFGKEPAYPLSGTYTRNGGSISFEVKDTTITNRFNKTEKDFFHTEQWEFMRFQGQVTLWTSNSVASWKEKHPHPILFPTSRKPEDIWERKK